MNKATICFIVIAAAVTLWVIKKLRASVAETAPLGYEDESGFHFGVPAMDK